MQAGLEKNSASFAGLNNRAALFLLGWFGINLLQASLTELTSDEGYYWFYAQHLQAGYYDHPPMIAVLIKAGTAIFPGELGVRFFNVVFSTAGLFLFLQLLPNAFLNNWRTYFVLLSAPLLHYLGFIVFPDGPLLFFTIAFLSAYRSFLKKDSVPHALYLGLTIALMGWSKYHGVLVVFFTVLANPQLLRSAKFYLAILIAAILFAPHLWWQYQHQFPTIQYHLAGRTGSFSFKHVGEYLSQQIFAIGPGLIFIPFVIKTKNIFERTLLFITAGTFVFFLATSFKTFVHFHWTSIAIFPLLYFAVAYYQQANRTKIFYSLVLPFVFLFLIARVLLAVPIIPAMHVGEDVYHGRKAWAEDIKGVAGNRPVFMPNNLREASLYSFYSGEKGVTLYTRPEKKSQYELWGYEDSLQAKEVVFITKYPFHQSKPLQNVIGQNLQYTFLPSFTSYYNGLSIYAAIYKRTADSIYATVEIFNNRRVSISFPGLNGEPASLICSVEKGKDIVRAEAVANLDTRVAIAPGKSQSIVAVVAIGSLPAGDYHLYFGIRNGVLPDAVISNKINLQVRK